jgi:glucose/arabinose dehydrogenase
LPPPDEFNQIKEGGDYGFVPNDPLNQPGKTPALLSFEPHSTPTGLAFYTGKAYPPEYFDNAFVALWNRGEIKRIQLIPDNRGGYEPDDSVFASGFLYPIDIVVGPDDNLYIADFGTSVVYRVVYAQLNG